MLVIFNKFSIDIHGRMITVSLYSLTIEYYKYLTDLDIYPSKGIQCFRHLLFRNHLVGHDIVEGDDY